MRPHDRHLWPFDTDARLHGYGVGPIHFSHNFWRSLSFLFVSSCVGRTTTDRRQYITRPHTASDNITIKMPLLALWQHWLNKKTCMPCAHWQLYRQGRCLVFTGSMQLHNAKEDNCEVLGIILCHFLGMDFINKMTLIFDSEIRLRKARYFWHYI